MKKVFIFTAVSLIVALSLLVYPQKAFAVQSTSISNKKVFLLIFKPTMGDGRDILTYYNWQNPVNISNQVIDFFKKASGGRLNFSIVKTQTVNDFNKLEDGFKYNPTAFHQCLLDNATCHQPQMADYPGIIQTYQVCNLVNSGTIDELWMWGGPYFGYYESRLAGPDAYWYNSSPLEALGCNKLIPIMGFNYERGVTEAVEDFGHRTESTFTEVYGGWSQNDISHLWNEYGLVKAQSSNYAASGCGSVHYPPNGKSDYDWSNKAYAPTYCDGFLSSLSPDMTKVRNINCDAWECTGIGYFEYWFKHMPSFSGVTDRVYNDWWKYISDPNTVLTTPANCKSKCSGKACGIDDGCGNLCKVGDGCTTSSVEEEKPTDEKPATEGPKDETQNTDTKGNADNQDGNYEGAEDKESSEDTADKSKEDVNILLTVGIIMSALTIGAAIFVIIYSYRQKFRKNKKENVVHEETAKEVSVPDEEQKSVTKEH